MIMKKLTILFLLLSAFLIPAVTKAFPVVTVSYSKGCTFCGRIYQALELTSVSLGTHEYTFWARSVSCSGFGLSQCPLPAPLTIDDEWVMASSMDMYTYARTEIDENDHSSGSHSINVYNVDLDITVVFLVEWSSDTEGNETITVTMDNGE